MASPSALFKSSTAKDSMIEKSASRSVIPLSDNFAPKVVFVGFDDVDLDDVADF